MTHEQLKEVYRKVYFPFGIEFNKMAELTNLSVVIYNSVKKKEPDVTIYDVIKRIMKDSDTNHDQFLIPLCLMIEVYLEAGELMFEPSTYGLKTGKDVTDRIRQILNGYVPF